MTLLLLARHGQTVWNSELRYQGQLDTPLSPLGVQQAERLAARLEDWKIAAVFSSDLRRCLDTAHAVTRRRDVPVITTPALREASYGEWQGLTYREVRDRYPHLVAQRQADPVSFAPPQGESLGQVHARVSAFLQQVADEHPREAVLVVTHGGPLRMLVASLLGMPLAAAFRLRMDNCGLSVCESFPRSPSLATVNDTCHLRGLASADPALGN